MYYKYNNMFLYQYVTTDWTTDWYKIFSQLLWYLYLYHTNLNTINYVTFVFYIQGGKLAVVNSTDLLKLLMTHSKMKALVGEGAVALVQRETGAIAGLERAVQAASAPTPGQQMLQAGYAGALADGTSHEQRSTATDHNTGQHLAQQVVERGALLPGGQGVHIQQALQQVSVSTSDLGKRKLHDDLVRMELEERAVWCEKQRIDNSNQKTENKITSVIRFAEAMTMLDSEWKNDRRVVLQTQDVLKSGFFRDSAAAREPTPLALGGGDYISSCSALASISIAQIALAMNVKLKHGEAVQVGTLARKLYKESTGHRLPSTANLWTARCG
jgi:hypothetical protein